MSRRWVAALAVAVLLAVSGCGTGGFSGLYQTPLPGGADVGEHPLHLTARFADVLDLVPQAAVKVADVAVGRVSSVALAPDTHSAVVSMTVNAATVLPANAVARLRQSSLLGEKFVELAAPPQGASGRLADGATIPLSATTRNPEVEEVLGALSLLLNGGGVDRIQTIVAELNKALSGNEPQLRSLLSTTDTLATQLDANRADIVHAITGLNRLAATFRAQAPTLNDALDKLGPGVRVLADQRGQFVAMLDALHQLSGVAVDTIQRSRTQLVDDLRQLVPTLHQLAAAGANLPVALRMLLTYPFPDYAGHVVKGDYFNVNAHLNLDLDKLVQNLANSPQPLIAPPPILGPAPATGAAPPARSVPETPAPRPGTRPGPLPGLVDGLGGILGGLLGGGG